MGENCMSERSEVIYDELTVGITASPPTIEQIMRWREAAQIEHANSMRRQNQYINARRTIAIVITLLYLGLWQIDLITWHVVEMEIILSMLLMWATRFDWPHVGFPVALFCMMAVVIASIPFQGEAIVVAVFFLSMFISGALLLMIYCWWDSAVDKSKKMAEERIRCLSDANRPQYLEIAEWLRHQEIETYRDAVVSQGRVFINAEVEGMRAWLEQDKATKSAEKKAAACREVYGIA